MDWALKAQARLNYRRQIGIKHCLKKDNVHLTLSLGLLLELNYLEKLCFAKKITILLKLIKVLHHQKARNRKYL